MADLKGTGVVARHVGPKVSERRYASGLPVEAVAEELGMNVADYELAEAGRVDFTPEQLVKLSPILGVKPSWFFEGL